jgi:NAD(P)-dependent dehydrogenase (short-subunit alcohol dehydrogenase family)
VGLLDGKVAIVTGAGRGIGRAEALLLAREGARVVVNDLGGSVRGEGSDRGPAQAVVEEIGAAGGVAVANADDCATWAGAEAMVAQAIDAYGGLDVLVCNAGIVRDRMSFNMSEEEFDAVVRVHLKGHFAPIHFAAGHWRQRSKAAGAPVDAAVVTTTSEAGLYGNAGQVNYVAAKAGIAAMTIALARELAPVGVRVNSIAPVAATRILGTAGVDHDADPRFAPENAAVGAVWLASPLAAGVSGQVLKIRGGVAQILDGWSPASQLDGPDLWTLSELDAGRDVLFTGVDPGVPPFRATENPPSS